MNQTKNIEFYENENTVSEEFQAEIQEEIESAPFNPQELIEIDADWEDVNRAGSETFAGDNPTPDQSDVEANAHAMGIDFQDNEPLDFTEKLEKRDRDRYELNEDSKADRETI
jgi:hypothetical protein